MTLTEAKNYRLTHLHFIGKIFLFPDFRCTVEQLIIAPCHRTAFERMKLFSMSLFDLDANEKALTSLNYLDEELAVYAVGTRNYVRYDKLLSECVDNQ